MYIIIENAFTHPTSPERCNAQYNARVYERIIVFIWFILGLVW